MSLDFNLTGIEGHEEKCVTEDRTKINPVTEALVFGCLVIGWGEITEANYRAWYTRLRSWEIVNGTMLRDYNDDGPIERPITLNEVHAHIGLVTNVFPKTTDAAFAKKLRLALEERVAREIRSASV